MLNIDQKIKEMGKDVHDDLYEGMTEKEWEWFSAVAYSKKFVQYGSRIAHEFFFLPNLDDTSYENAFKEKHPDKTEEEVWEVLKAEIKEDLKNHPKIIQITEIVDLY